MRGKVVTNKIGEVMLERIENLQDLEPGSDEFVNETKGISNMAEAQNKTRTVEEMVDKNILIPQVFGLVAGFAVTFLTMKYSAGGFIFDGRAPKQGVDSLTLFDRLTKIKK